MANCERKHYLTPFYQGDTHAIRLTFTDTEADAPVDFTGWDFFLTMKLNPYKGDDEAAVRVDMKDASGPDVAEGRVDLPIPLDQSQALVPAIYYLDVQAVSPEGAVTTLFAGRQQVLPNVTRRTS